MEREDLESLQSAVNELSARFNLQLDWGGDLDDEDFAGLDGVQLMATAFDRLREPHAVGVDAGSDGFTGVMALTRDDDAMLALCSLLNVEIGWAATRSDRACRAEPTLGCISRRAAEHRLGTTGGTRQPSLRPVLRPGVGNHRLDQLAVGVP